MAQLDVVQIAVLVLLVALLLLLVAHGPALVKVDALILGPVSVLAIVGRSIVVTMEAATLTPRTQGVVPMFAAAHHAVAASELPSHHSAVAQLARGKTAWQLRSAD